MTVQILVKLVVPEKKLLDQMASPVDTKISADVDDFVGNSCCLNASKNLEEDHPKDFNVNCVTYYFLTCSYKIDLTVFSESR